MIIFTSLFAGLLLIAVAALYIYTLPALRRLPDKKPQALNGTITIDDALVHLRKTGKSGWELVAEAQKLTNRKMAYSRRNGWDTPFKAFERGMGFCQQQAMALLTILKELGIEARPVHAFRCRFPPGQIHEYWEGEQVSGHAWLSVRINGEAKDVCPGHPDNTPGNVHFEILTKKRPYGPVMRIIGHIGSMVLNAKWDNAAVRREAKGG